MTTETPDPSDDQQDNAQAGCGHPPAAVLLEGAVAGMCFREIAERHGVESAEQAEERILDLLHRWVPATRDKAIRQEHERLDRLLNRCDYLACRSSSSPTERSKAIRLGIRIRSMLDAISAADPNRPWFADEHQSFIGVAPDMTPEYRREMLEALEQLGGPRLAAEATAILEAAVDSPPPDRYLDQGGRRRAEVMPRLQRIAFLADAVVRSLGSSGQYVQVLSELVRLERSRIDILELVDGRRR